MEPTSPLTDEQANLVADQIAQTSQNVYRVAETIIDRKLTSDETDVVYKHVERSGQIFKCSECNLWKANSERGSQREDQCAECENEETAEDGETEDDGA